MQHRQNIQTIHLYTYTKDTHRQNTQHTQHTQYVQTYTSTPIQCYEYTSIKIHTYTR